jgi:hypothetical protein
MPPWFWTWAWQPYSYCVTFSYQRLHDWPIFLCRTHCDITQLPQHTWNCLQCPKLLMTVWSFSSMVLLHTMRTSLRNFLMRHFHGTGLGGRGGMEAMVPMLSGPDTPAFLFLRVMWSKSSTLFIFTTCSPWKSESGMLLHGHCWCSWPSVAGNGIPLRCLQSHLQLQ